ncbi:MAG: diguanylate cyclase protein [Haloplasmataceae bacterium]|nr:diguanylate cyclase protein [Haloplasmataceae bacterium]
MVVLYILFIYLNNFIVYICYNIGNIVELDVLYLLLNDYVVVILILSLIITIIILNGLYQYKINVLSKKIQSNEVNLDLAVASGHLILLKIDWNGKIISFNNYFSALFNYGHNSLLDLLDELDKPSFDLFINLIKMGKNIKNFELKLKNCEGKYYHILWSTNNIDENSHIVELTGVDFTERVALENELIKQNIILEENQKNIWDLAYLDKLTRLYNRIYFIEKCNEILNDEGVLGAFILVDLDNFEYLNNIFGPSKSEEIIKEVASNIINLTKSSNIVAKLKDDEFAILLLNTPIMEVENYINRLIEKNVYSVTYEGITIHISISIGVSLFPNDGNNYDILFKTASFALMNAKENGKNQFILYDESIEKKLIEKMAVESMVRVGIENNRFFLVYQPQYNIKTGLITGFEALLRLRDHQDNVIPPNDFIYIAEETKLIIPIGYWVINEACSFLIKLNNLGINNLTISINVSVIQFLQDDFVDNVINIINKFNINPQFLELEITETSLMTFNQRNLNKMNELKDFGINIALDDFGTGYSSLVYFKKTTNISILKIDREFINDIHINNNIEIVDAMIYLGHKFNFTVIAEGVETVEQFNILSSLGCDKMQGYLGSKPIGEDIIFNEFSHLESINSKIFK